MADYRGQQSDSGQDINWADTIKKEARGESDYDLGEVQGVAEHYIHTQRGVGSGKEQFFIPKALASTYDGDTLRFRVSAAQANEEFMRDFPLPAQEYVSRYESGQRSSEESGQGEAQEQVIRVPLKTEEVVVTRKPVVKDEEVVIRKVPVTETQVISEEVTSEQVSGPVRVEKKTSSVEEEDQEKKDTTT